MIQAVLDTNGLLSGYAIPDSVPGRIVTLWYARAFRLVMSQAILEEFARAHQTLLPTAHHAG